MPKCPKCGFAASSHAQSGAGTSPGGGLASLRDAVRGGDAPRGAPQGHDAQGDHDDDLGMMDDVLSEIPEVMGKGLASKLAAGKKRQAPVVVEVEVEPSHHGDSPDDEDEEDGRRPFGGRGRLT